MNDERMNDFVLKIANVNGSGSASANGLLYKSIYRSGVPVSAKNIFPSNIQGLPTWFEIRANKEGHTARSARVDLLVAMNPQTIDEDIASVTPGGYFLYDSTWPLKERQKRNDITFLPVPLAELSIESFPDVKIRILMKNITYVGAVAAFLDIKLPVIQKLLEEIYAKKPQLSESNMKAVTMSYDFVTKNFECPLPIKISAMSENKNTTIITGNGACALGCIYAGATVSAWYPITPATSVTNVFEQLCHRFRKDPETGKLNAIIVQAEDELAAAGIAVGAGWAGARSFTSTSGAGISLMNEFIGFAYYTEIPVVFFDIQRVGPSTGMPTRTQQGDIMFTAYASHGDTKHILLFPADPQECFHLTVKAFDLAERFQTPVFVVSDLDIGMNEWVVPQLEWDDSYQPDRGKILSNEDLKSMDKFYRYLDVDGDGIAARTVPGMDSKGAYFLRGSGHNKYGGYTEKSDEYMEVVDRLLKKFHNAAAVVPPSIIETGRSRKFAIITIGGCDLAVREAMDKLSAEGMQFDFMRIRAFPFTDEINDFLKDHETCFVIEQNRDGQLRNLLILESCAEKRQLVPILLYGGMPIDAESIMTLLRKAMKEGNS